jgi:predicted amidohydrolase YtcJ
MKNLIISLSILVMVISSSGNKKQNADLVIINGKVLTIDKDNPIAESIAVNGERIIAVGSLQEIKEYIKKGKTVIIDARGRLVIPWSFRPA